jgi:hypothetical protein
MCSRRIGSILEGLELGHREDNGEEARAPFPMTTIESCFPSDRVKENSAELDSVPAIFQLNPRPNEQNPSKAFQGVILVVHLLARGRSHGEHRRIRVFFNLK